MVNPRHQTPQGQSVALPGTHIIIHVTVVIRDQSPSYTNVFSFIYLGAKGVVVANICTRFCTPVFFCLSLFNLPGQQVSLFYYVIIFGMITSLNMPTHIDFCHIFSDFPGSDKSKGMWLFTERDLHKAGEYSRHPQFFSPLPPQPLVL